MGVRTPQITEEKHFLITFQDYQPKSSVDRKQSKISEAIADDDDEATTNIIDHKRRQVILRLSAFGHWFWSRTLKPTFFPSSFWQKLSVTMKVIDSNLNNAKNRPQTTTVSNTKMHLLLNWFKDKKVFLQTYHIGKTKTSNCQFQSGCRVSICVVQFK